ncbi:MAG TPA: ATP-binding protein [Burkholderiaceae bacterium]|nr:ATP-binding protein [Burkholderiaceae bacterium]
MNFGIKQKILLVLLGVLGLSTALNVLLASYFTDRQNEEAAFTGLRGELRAWLADLQEMTEQLRIAGTAAVADLSTLEQLGDLVSREINLSPLANPTETREWSRTLGYRKSVSLNRLQLAMRTSGFSSISVYTEGRLSHSIDVGGAGMSIRREDGSSVWLSVSNDPSGELPLRNWPVWEESPLPANEKALREVPTAPRVSFVFRQSNETAIEIAVPVQGYIAGAMSDEPSQPVRRFYSELSVPGARGTAPAAVPARPVIGRAAKIFAVVVFRKLIDSRMLQKVSTRTGTLPLLLSPDGGHRQVLADGFPLPKDWSAITSNAFRSAEPTAASRLVSDDLNSFYVAMLPWNFEGKPALVLGLASRRDGTLANIRQTVVAILLVAIATMLFSLAVGSWLVKRFTDPIVDLTSAVRRMTGRGASGKLATPIALERLQPVDIEAPDEVGALAQAFNDMVAELRRSFETLESRVQARTAELRQQARYLRTLIDMLPMRAWFKDTEGHFLAVNQAEAKAIGIAADELVGKSDAEVRTISLADAYRAEDLEVMRSADGLMREEAEPGPNGMLWKEVFKARVVDEDGRVLGTVGVARDISDRKEAEIAREAALAEAQRLARLRSEFLARMSHELRTPLNGILGFAQILRMDSTMSERQARGLAVIEESGRHLLALIEDILDLARIDAAKLALNPAKVNLPVFLHAVCDIVRVNAENKGLTFSYQSQGHLPEDVILDDRRLRQVLLNLLSNAIKFTDRGEVTLRVQVVNADACREANSSIRFEVQDTGIGLSEADQTRLFQPFEQVAEASRREGGAGLGLAISRQLVRLMGGDITVRSKAGEGSVFSFELELPKAPTEDARAEEPVWPTGYEGDRRKVMVVDDVSLNRVMAVESLKRLGFEVLEVEDGQAALDAAAQIHPDLILLDISMPGIDGFEVTRIIRHTPPLARIPIVLISASITGDVERQCSEAGADAFLPKPMDQHRMMDVLARLLGLKWTYETIATAA